jgi:hypothetical protein
MGYGMIGPHPAFAPGATVVGRAVSVLPSPFWLRPALHWRYGSAVGPMGRVGVAAPSRKGGGWMDGVIIGPHPAFDAGASVVRRAVSVSKTQPLGTNFGQSAAHFGFVSTWPCRRGGAHQRGGGLMGYGMIGPHPAFAPGASVVPRMVPRRTSHGAAPAHPRWRCNLAQRRQSPLSQQCGHTPSTTYNHLCGAQHCPQPQHPRQRGLNAVGCFLPAARGTALNRILPNSAARRVRR